MFSFDSEDRDDERLWPAPNEDLARTLGRGGGGDTEADREVREMTGEGDRRRSRLDESRYRIGCGAIERAWVIGRLTEARGKGRALKVLCHARCLVVLPSRLELT